MEIRRRPPRHPRSGPSCLLMFSVIFAAFLGGFIVANRDEVRDAILPDPTPTPTQSPGSHATRAKFFERDGEFENAVSAWEQAVELDPENIDYQVNLIELLVRTGNPADALEIAEVTKDLAPENDRVWTSVAAAHLEYGEELQGRAVSAGEQFVLAAESGQNAIQLNATNADAYAYTAGALVRQDINLVPQALELAQTGLAIEPTNPNVLYWSAEVLTLQGYYETARDQLVLAIDYDEELVDAYVSLARIYYFYSDNSVAARNLVSEAIDQDPDNAELYDTLAYFHLYSGLYADAQDAAQQAVEYDPNLVRARAKLGHAFYKNNNNYPEAIKELEIATASYGSPNAETALYFAMLGLAYYFEDAANCDRSVELFADSLAVARSGSPAETSALAGLDFCRQVEINQP